MLELEKENKKVPGKYKWETLDFIPLMPLVGVNHCQPILHIYKRMVHFYSIDESIHKFSIGYMINLSHHFNKVFKEQVEKCLSAKFHLKTMETIKYFLRNNNTCVMALIMFY